MEIGKRYIVTKASDDGTFEVGDHIVLCADGAIECTEAQGWLDSSAAKESVVGMEVAIDQEWIERRRQKLRDELQRIAEHHEDQRAAWSDEDGDADQAGYHEERRNFALFHLTPNKEVRGA